MTVNMTVDITVNMAWQSIRHDSRYDAGEVQVAQSNVARCMGNCEDCGSFETATTRHAQSLKMMDSSLLCYQSETIIYSSDTSKIIQRLANHLDLPCTA